MSSASDTEARLIFDLGLGNGTFSFDNFVLRKVNSYTISATVNNTNAGNITGTGVYDYAKTVTLTSSPKTGFTFMNWTENGVEVSLNPSYTFTANGNRTLRANFAIKSYTIAANTLPANSGTITGDGSYDHGTTITLTATPASEQIFSNWTENGTPVSTTATYSFTADANRTLVANFILKSYSIEASAIPVNSGTITGAGNYNYGTTVTLTAKPATGYTFKNWTENGTQVSTKAKYTYTADANRTLVANFIRNTSSEDLFNSHLITIYPNPVFNELMLEIDGNSENVNLEFFNTVGKMVYNERMVARTIINTSSFAPGVYLIKLDNGKSLQYRKIVKE
jgi:hypothetical protein